MAAVIELDLVLKLRFVALAGEADQQLSGLLRKRRILFDVRFLSTVFVDGLILLE